MKVRLFYFLGFNLFFFLLSSCAYLRETPSYREEELQARRAAAESRTKTPAESGFYREFSSLLGYTLSGNENPALIREIASWLGTPYRFGGQTRTGTDCSGFARAVYLQVYGIDLARVTVKMAQNSTRVGRRGLREGDLVFFRINGQKISHVGIYISNNRFVHASTSRGVIISDIDDPFYAEHFAFGGRVRR